MAQFASTLYPQTNPSNPILLSFKRDCDWYSSSSVAAKTWLDNWNDLLTWGPSFVTASTTQIDHARRVLTRLASLTG